MDCGGRRLCHVHPNTRSILPSSTFVLSTLSDATNLFVVTHMSAPVTSWTLPRFHSIMISNGHRIAASLDFMDGEDCISRTTTGQLGIIN